MDVKVSGVVLSSLMADVARTGDCEGLLWGKETHSTHTSLNDSGEGLAVSTASSHTVLQSYTVTGPPFSFYDTAGTVLPDRVKEVAGGKGMAIVGWFSYRRDTPLMPSVRETAVHTSLCAASLAGPSSAVTAVFSEVDGGAPPPPAPSSMFASNLVFLAMTSRLDSDCTHSHEHRLYRVVPPRTLLPVSLEVVNLAANAQAEYRSFHAGSLLTTATSAGGAFGDIVSDFGGAKLAALVEPVVPPEVAELERLVECTATQLGHMLATLEKKEAEAEALALENAKLRVAS